MVHDEDGFVGEGAERARVREREREWGNMETTGYEPFALHAPIHWAIKGHVIKNRGSCGQSRFKQTISK